MDRTILDSLSAHIAIIDKVGMIMLTNRAWQEYGKANQIQINPDTLNINYLDICKADDSENARISRKVAQGIQAVLDGKFDGFSIDYPCHSPTRKMWFYLRATRIRNSDPYHAVISHENITPLKLAEETIKERERELRIKSENLEEANTALKVLLKRREEDKIELEEKVVTNVQQLITPYLEKLTQTRLDTRQRTFLEILESHLNDIVSPFLHKMSTMHLQLTPQEIQVATLIKSGRTSKEIANILSISTNAVDFHRKNIRKKFGLNHQKTNLRSFLLTLP